MFKSIFAKYVTTFAAFLAASFLLLLFVVNSVVSNDARRAQEENMEAVAAACAENLSLLYRSEASSEGVGLRDLLSEDAPAGEAPRRLLSAFLVGFEDMTVYVTDVSGGFIFSAGKNPPASPEAGEILFNLAETDEATTVKASAGRSPVPSAEAETENARPGRFLNAQSLASPLQDAHVYLLPVAVDSDPCVGYVMIATAAEARSDALNDTLQSMIVAALWVMVAALIAIYFITERIVSPLREMSKAAKRMAVGQFDARVPVRGRDEVAQLAVAFNQMAGDLENLERMRNTFVANVSHDLRTPMTTISGFIDGILDGVIPPEQERHYLQVVSEEVRRLSRLVTALLDVSRLQAGDRKFDFRPFDICEMGRLILISFEKKIDEKGLDVTFECDEDRMFVLADQDAIHQILYNICDNAVKFASERGKLKVSFTWASVEGSRHRKAVVKVYNEGQGIPAEDLPFVFERFYKSDKSRSLDKSGVGLGMFISKAIIDAHGETISVASEYGKYCQFTFTLTRTDPPAQKGRVGATQGGTS